MFLWGSGILPDFVTQRAGSLFRQPNADFTPRQIGPFDLPPHRVSGSVFMQHRQKILFHLRDHINEPSASTTFIGYP